MSIVRRTLALAALAAVLPLPTVAQPLGKLVLTPYVGAYAPSTKVARLNEADGGTTFAASAEHKNAFALGATASYWFVPRVGVELGGVYAFSDVTSRFAMQEPGSPGDFSNEVENAGVILGNAKLMVGLFPSTSDFQLRFGVGPAIIQRVGSAYKADAEGRVTGRTDFGGAVSLCTKLPIGTGMALRLRVEDFMYRAKLGWQDKQDPSGSFTFDSRFQNDFVLSAGLQIGLMR